MHVTNNTNETHESQFDNFVMSLESYSPEIGKRSSNWVEKLSSKEKSIVGNTVHQVTQFINDNNLYVGGTAIQSNILKEVHGLESINPNVKLANIGPEKIVTLCRNCGISDKQLRPACEAISNIIIKMADTPGSYYANHFSNARDQVEASSIRLTDLSDILPSTLHNEFLGGGVVGRESFGAETDRVLPDIRINMAVTMLRFHRSLLDRIMHRRTSPSTVIKYVIPYAEVYDLMKSMDPDSQVRNGKIHRTPMIGLYSDPKIVTNSLRRIIVKTDNDLTGVVLRQDVLKPNCSGNIMQLSRVAGEIGNNHIDYTDLIADGVTLDSVYVTLAADGKTEEFKISTRSYSKSRLQMQANATDSADRGTMFTQFFKFYNTRTTVTGATSEILAGLTETDCLELEVRISPELNLKHHEFSSSAHIVARAYNSDRAPVAAVVTDLIAKLSVDIVGYTLDAKYSEENLRKSNVAIRSHYRTMDWEIPVGRNYIVDYALNQAQPDFLMANVTEAISLGQDHRALDMIVKTMMDVYDRNHDENSDMNFRENIYRVGFDYVAGQQVRPVILLGSIDLEEVDTVRSSDILGDIRQFVEHHLVNLFSILHQTSYYRTQLNDGEKPTYKCVTSAVILENLLSIPHIHNHLMDSKYGETADGNTVEYRRVLPSGVVLECVTVPFDYMRDKMVFFPYRPNDPESVLNYGHNWDYGTYLAHYTPQIANGVNKRVFANAREMPLITNPIGLYVEVRNISKAIDINHLANMETAAAVDFHDMLIAVPDTSSLKGPGSVWHTPPTTVTP